MDKDEDEDKENAENEGDSDDSIFGNDDGGDKVPSPEPQ
jgi:hypothetical protein